MRNFENFDRYLDILLGDIYAQPSDFGHTAMASIVINKWVGLLNPCRNVLDVGCGQGFTAPMFYQYGIDFTGVAIGEDAKIASESKGLKVYNEDFHFLHFDDESFDLIFSRHSLEHSPMPLLALMEWQRVSRNWLCLVLPNAEHYGWAGLNHYSVMHPNQVEFLLDRAGWHIIWSDFDEPTELRYMCEKKRQSHYEQYLEGKDKDE